MYSKPYPENWQFRGFIASFANKKSMLLSCIAGPRTHLAVFSMIARWIHLSFILHAVRQVLSKTVALSKSNTLAKYKIQFGLNA